MSPLQLIVDHPCKVKKELGQGDARTGTGVLLELLHTDPKNVLLAPHEASCGSCLMNALRKPFGCVTSLPVPIPVAVEKWFTDRLQPISTIGGALYAESTVELGLTGEPTRRLRAAGWFASGLSAGTTAEPLFDVLFGVGPLLPWQSLNVLLWLGGLKLGDTLCTRVADARTLTRLEPIDRAKQTKLFVGVEAASPAGETGRNVLRILFMGWVRDTEIRIRSQAARSSS